MAGTQTWLRRLVIHLVLRIQLIIRHPRAPVLLSLPPSLQFRYTCCALDYRISTYISFDGPSEVSTLPSTSSANLPVAVRGSYGGATGSVSSLFPSLNKAFVVGPGYAPVLYKLVSKSLARLFVDLADLLPDNIRAQEVEPAFLERKLVE